MGSIQKGHELKDAFQLVSRCRLLQQPLFILVSTERYAFIRHSKPLDCGMSGRRHMVCSSCANVAKRCQSFKPNSLRNATEQIQTKSFVVVAHWKSPHKFLHQRYYIRKKIKGERSFIFMKICSHPEQIQTSDGFRLLNIAIRQHIIFAVIWWWVYLFKPVFLKMPFVSYPSKESSNWEAVPTAQACSSLDVFGFLCFCWSVDCSSHWSHPPCFVFKSSASLSLTLSFFLFQE